MLILVLEKAVAVKSKLIRGVKDQVLRGRSSNDETLKKILVFQLFLLYHLAVRGNAKLL